MAKPRHDEADTSSGHQSGEWDKDSKQKEEGLSEAAPIDWPRLQSAAATSGGIALALVFAATVAGTTDVPLVAYNSLPNVVQQALPSKTQLGIQKDTGQIDLAAVVQNATVRATLQSICTTA